MLCTSLHGHQMFVIHCDCDAIIFSGSFECCLFSSFVIVVLLFLNWNKDKVVTKHYFYHV